jgi:transposase
VGPAGVPSRDDLGVGRGDLSDGQWAVLEPLLPVAGVGRPAVSQRRLIDGIRWRVRAGTPWRDIPPEYGPWQTVYGLFRRWQREGVWAMVLTRLQARADAAGLITWEVNVDSTVCRAHQHAAGARCDGSHQKEPPGGSRTEPGDHALGRSRGGFTTKIHLACEQGQRPLSLLVTAGQRGDSPQFVALLEAIRVPRTGPGRPRVRPVRVRGRQGVFIPREPGLPAQTWNPLHDRGTGRPDRAPQATRKRGRPASCFRPRGLQGPARGRVRHQPAEAEPGRCHPVRQGAIVNSCGSARFS